MRLYISAAAVTGIVIGAVGASFWTESPSAQGDARALRYQIVINPQARADTFLLDTATGRIWAPGRYVAWEGEPRVWELEQKFDTKQQVETFLATQAIKK